MGNENKSTSPRPGVASDFYWACRNGDVQQVTLWLPSMTYDDINSLQPNGSTALHAASFYGHGEIVKLLLDCGCDRTILNRHKLTAYQEAKTDEIQNIFKRPDSDEPRFMSYDNRDLFQLKDIKNIDDVPDNWVRGYLSVSETANAQFILAVHRTRFFRLLIQRKTELESDRHLKEIVEETVIKKNHKESPKMINLLENFLRHSKRRVDHLIHMYTVESPFYSALHDDNSSFTLMLYMHLHEYRNRAYKGYSYRGAAMTTSDIDAYKWAQQNVSRVLETCALQSTSKEKTVAEEFAKKNKALDKHTVLLIYSFPEPCKTALALSCPSGNENDLCLSEFENEAEVLILPYTLFQVTKVLIDEKSKWYYIFLKNVPVPENSVLSAWLQANMAHNMAHTMPEE